MAQGVLGDSGIIPVTDVPSSGGVKHPPNEGEAVESGTSCPMNSLG